MRIPDPKANTTTEAYLAYKAGYLEESELKPVLYEPDWHFDGWLAYWAGLVNTYPTKENGDPEMLCDEEALVAYLSGVTDTYPEEIKDPYDVRIVGYLRHLASIRWPEPDYPVNNEEFYLSTMEPTHTSNPEPSADIELDTAEGKIISLEAYGDTTQQTYSGKNLLPYPYADGDSKTVRGITYTVNADGTVILNGQNDETGSAVYYFIDRYGTMPLFELSAGTYYFIPNTEGVEYEVYDGTNYYAFNANNNFSVTFPTNVSIRQLYALVRKKNQTQFTNYKIYPMLTTVAGQTELDYEPYVGGTPSPNPDYPQDVQVVTGAQNVWVHGKNMIDNNDLTFDHCNVSSSYIHLSTLPTGIRFNTTYHSTTGSPALLFKTSIDLTKYAGKTIRMKATFGEKGEVSITRTNDDTSIRTTVADTSVSGQTISWTVPEDVSDAKWLCYRIRIIRPGNEDYTVDFTDFIMTIDEADMTYGPYHSQTYTINLGSTELCKIGDYQDYIYKSGDDWYVHKGCSKIIYDGSEDESWTYTNGSIYPFRMEIADAANLTSTQALPPNIFSNYYTPRKWNFDAQTETLPDTCITALVSKIFAIRNVDIETLADFKTWLSSHNLINYYPLATATDTKITDATLVGQLDELSGADTCNGKTYIEVTANGPNLPALLKVEAYKY